MHKAFIGFFIPAIYTVYCTMLYGVSNQFEVFRMKDGTTTTVIRITRNSIMVDSTTDNVMDWEFTVTNSATGTVKKPTETRRAKWVFPAIIKEKMEKVACFRYGIIGHKVDKCIFFFARWPVATATTTTTTTTIPKTIIEKAFFRIGKKK